MQMATNSSQAPIARHGCSALHLAMRTVNIGLPIEGPLEVCAGNNADKAAAQRAPKTPGFPRNSLRDHPEPAKSTERRLRCAQRTEGSRSCMAGNRGPVAVSAPAWRHHAVSGSVRRSSTETVAPASCTRVGQAHDRLRHQRSFRPANGPARPGAGPATPRAAVGPAAGPRPTGRRRSRGPRSRRPPSPARSGCPAPVAGRRTPPSPAAPGAVARPAATVRQHVQDRVHQVRRRGLVRGQAHRQRQLRVPGRPARRPSRSSHRLNCGLRPVCSASATHVLARQPRLLPPRGTRRRRPAARRRG